MDNEPKESIDPRARKVWMIGGTIGSVIVLLISIGLYALITIGYGAPDWMGWVALALGIAYAPWGIYFSPWLRMRMAVSPG